MTGKIGTVAEVKGQSQEAGAGKILVLLVEDHPINQKLATVLLQRMGFQVDLAKDGAEAVLASRKQVL